MYKAHRVLQSQCTPSIGERGSRRGHVSHGCFTPHLALRSFAGRLSLDGDSDYLSGADKSGKLHTQVDELVSAGRLEPLGFYGFGTWIGRWLIDTL
jgi:hypothetical protein